MSASSLMSEDQATVEDVTAAYRLFLGRKPEPEGFDYFSRAVRDGLSLKRLSQMFIEAPEFRGRNKIQTNLAEIDLGGYRVLVDPDEVDLGLGLVKAQDYEPHVRRAINELFHPGQTFLDVGANIGCIAFLAAKIAGPTGSVIAVEPFPSNLQRIYAGITLNGYNNVRVIPLAASDRRETFSLTGGTSNTYTIPALDYKTPGNYTQSVVLDDLLGTEPAIHFIKMDIEGHEPHAFRGLARTIAKHEPTLLTEFHPMCIKRAGVEPVDYLRQILAHYRNLHVITNYHEPATFTAAEPLMECWRKRNAELAAEGKFLEGTHHFDIIATNRDI